MAPPSLVGGLKRPAENAADESLDAKKRHSTLSVGPAPTLSTALAVKDASGHPRKRLLEPSALPHKSQDGLVEEAEVKCGLGRASAGQKFLSTPTAQDAGFRPWPPSPKMLCNVCTCRWRMDSTRGAEAQGLAQRRRTRCAWAARDVDVLGQLGSTLPARLT